MASLREFLFYFFLLLVFLNGVWSVFFPERVIAFREKRAFGLSWISGGIYFRTKFRVRFLGLMLITIAALLFILAFLESK